MHKKLANDLTSLAHSILRMKDKDDVFALKDKAHELYEKLALLAYVEEYINTTPNAEFTKEELVAIIEKSPEKEVEAPIKNESIEEEVFEIKAPEPEIDLDLKKKVFVEEKAPEPEITLPLKEEIKEETTIIDEVIPEKIIEEKPKVAEIEEQPFDELESILAEEPKIEVETPKTESKPEVSENKEVKKVHTLEDELAGTISVDVMANLFEKIEPKKTLHDKLQDTIQIGLNDRIAFVKNLFNDDQEDFNRVISQLNTLNTEKAAKNFITKMVKPDYDWSDKEEYETRLLEIIERRFIVE